MKKMFALMFALMLVLITVPAFAGHGEDSTPAGVITLDAASFAGVMGIASGTSASGNTTATATNIATAGPVTVTANQATTNATSTGNSNYTVTGSGQAMAIQFGAALASYSNNGGTVTGTFVPLTAGSVATFGVTW